MVLKRLKFPFDYCSIKTDLICSEEAIVPLGVLTPLVIIIIFMHSKPTCIKQSQAIKQLIAIGQLMAIEQSIAIKQSIQSIAIKQSIATKQSMTIKQSLADE